MCPGCIRGGEGKTVTSDGGFGWGAEKGGRRLFKLEPSRPFGAVHGGGGVGQCIPIFVRKGVVRHHKGEGFGCGNRLIGEGVLPCWGAVGAYDGEDKGILTGGTHAVGCRHLNGQRAGIRGLGYTAETRRDRIKMQPRRQRQTPFLHGGQCESIAQVHILKRGIR